MGQQTLNDLRDLALDVADAGDAKSAETSLGLGPMGVITLDELRAIAQDTRTLGEILRGV